MTMIVAVSNLKGGVGKSTVARNVAVYFSSKGEKVCIVDTDIVQRTTCEWKERREKGEHRVDVFPMSTMEGLPKDIKTHQDNGYSVIIIDGVPQLEEVTTKIILISDFILIPITPSIDDLKSFQKFLSRYQDAKSILKGIREIYAFTVLNKYSGRNNEDLEMKEAIDLFEEQGIIPLKATLEDRVAHRRSSKYGLTVLEWEDKKAKKEVEELCTEIETTLVNLIAG